MVGQPGDHRHLDPAWQGQRVDQHPSPGIRRTCGAHADPQQVHRTGLRLVGFVQHLLDQPDDALQAGFWPQPGFDLGLLHDQKLALRRENTGAHGRRAQVNPDNRYLSPFDCSGGQAADDITREDQREEHRRNSCQHTTGHHTADIDHVAPGELGDRHRHRLGSHRAGEDQGKEELIPGGSGR